MSILRFDRLITLYFSHYLKQLLITRNEQIPILMYHSISNEDEQRVHPYYKTNTTPAIFDMHMSFLYKNDYKVINLNDAMKHLRNNSKLKEKYVVITFDDGFYDFFTNAFPILKKHNFSATVFLPTGFINKERSSFKGKECMTWDEVRRLSGDGIVFGSHTVNHPQLKNLSGKEIEHEIRSSKEKIEAEIGIIVESFSYPFAFPEDKKFGINLKAILKKSGYVNGVSTKIGTTNKNQDKYFCPRLPANSDDDILFFKSKLEGAYNWLGKPQYFFKRIKDGRKA